MNKTPMKILFVDDDITQLRLYKMLLNRIQNVTYDCYYESEYFQGLHRIKSEEFHVIFLDYWLDNEKTGIDIINSIDLETTSSVFIFLTSETSPQIDKEICEAGAHDYLNKSKIDLDTLDRSIRYALNHFESEEKRKRNSSNLLSLVNAIPSPVLLIRVKDHKPVYWNQKFLDIMRLSHKQFEENSLILGKKILGQHLIRNISNQSSSNQEYNFERLDGTHIRIIVSINEAFYFDQKCAFFIYQDVTDIRKIEWMQKKEEIKISKLERLESLERMAGGFAHEFNNILQTIIEYNDFLLSQKVDQKVFKDIVSEILKVSKKGADQIKRIQSFSKNYQKSKNTVIDLSQFFDGIMNTLNDISPPKIEIEVQFLCKNTFVTCDHAALEQAVQQIALNGFESMEGQNSLLLITIQKSIYDEKFSNVLGENKEGQFVVISVIDTGCGIKQEKVGRVFDPYYTNKDPQYHSGLGLTAVYSFIRRCGGNLGVQTKLGTGSNFSLMIPLKENL